MRQRAQRGNQASHRGGGVPAGWLREADGSQQAVPLTHQRWVILGHVDSALCR